MAYRYPDDVPKPLKTPGYNYTDDIATKLATKAKTDAYLAAGRAEPVTISTGGGATESTNAYLNGLLEQQAAAKAQRDAAVNNAFNMAKNSLDENKTAALRDTYVTYMKGLKNMPQFNAINGNGGYAQTLTTRQQLGYQNDRAGIQQSYINALQELEANKAAKLLENEDNYLSGVLGLDSTAQKYLSQLKAVQNNPVTETKGVKVGNTTMTTQDYINYLISVGYSPAQAAKLFKEKGLSY